MSVYRFSTKQFTQVDESVLLSARTGGLTEILASGGTKTTSGGYTIHTFTSVGADSLVSNVSGVSVDFLLIAGGGCGDGPQRQAGGGGAGGYLYLTGQTLPKGSSPVVVGDGGKESQESGEDSSFLSQTAVGGGYGGFPGANGGNGGVGGSGGGASSVTGEMAYGGSATAGQGRNGGAAGPNNAYPYSGGGGGGAGEDGKPGDSSLGGAGDGGDGLQNSISGTSTWYAGGGGGAAFNFLEWSVASIARRWP
jgi:hypothetical protein